MTQPPPGWWYGPDGRWYPPASGAGAPTPQQAAHGPNQPPGPPAFIQQPARLPPGYAPAGAAPTQFQAPGYQQFAAAVPGYQAPAFLPPPRNRRRRVWWILGAVCVVVVVAIVVLAAVTSSDSPVQARVGQSITLHGQPHETGVVTVVRIIDPATPGAKFGPDTSGGRYVGVVLTVKNTGTVDIGDADLSGSLNDGTYFEAAVGLQDCPLLASAIKPGQTATDCNAFDVLVDAKVSDYTLQFNWDGAREGQWNVH